MSPREPDLRVPRLGDTVHYVINIADEEMESKRGDEFPMLVMRVKPHPIYKNRIEVDGIATTFDGPARIKCYDDQECKVPGSWHWDDDCLEESCLEESWKPQE